MFMEYIYIYMNSTTPKRHAETLRNRNISFQLKKQNIYRNGIDNLDSNMAIIITIYIIYKSSRLSSIFHVAATADLLH